MNTSRALFICIACISATVAMLLSPTSAEAPGKTLGLPAPRYKVRVERNVMVPMRDGIRLATDLYFPEGEDKKLPAILIRTPYNKDLEYERKWPGPYMFAEQGYVVAVQDTRGRFRSEGEFTISTPDVEDGYDTTNWLAQQPWSTGKVGTFGCSYLGDVQIMQARAKNPHLMAMIPQAAGSSFPHRGFGVWNGGTVEVAQAIGWFWYYGSKLFLRPPPGQEKDFWAKFDGKFNPAPKPPDVQLRKLWWTLPVIDIMKSGGAIPSDYEAAVSHGPNDPWWYERGYLRETDTFDTPALQVNSWYDFGIALTLNQFNLMRTNAQTERGRDNQFMIVSPTTHCMSETATEQTVVGERPVGDARFDYYGLYLRWFDHWLKDIDNGVTKTPKLQIYVMGKNQWRGENEWPLARTKYTKFYLRSDGHANSLNGTGILSTDPPSQEPADKFVYDPQHPVASLGGPVCCTGTADAPEGSFDQSAVEVRNDVLVYTSPRLRNGVEVTGPLKVVLYVSSSARDTDFTAKLVDVYPDGTAYNIQEGILRARYREGWLKKVWMKPDEVYELTIDLEATSNFFGPGHRIRLEVSSSNFPRFDRNLNTGGNNIDEANPVVAHNVVHHSKQYQSHILLPVIP